MSFLLVKYKCDAITEIVPLTYVKNWKAWKNEKDVQVFWSPDGETPSDVYLAQGKILDVEEIPETGKGKKLKPLPGYYKATVIKTAESREELEIIYESKEMRSNLKRKGSPEDFLEIKSQKQKVVNLSSSYDSLPVSQKASQILPPARLKTLSNKANIDKLVKMPSLFERKSNNCPKDPLDDSLTDSSCSDDGVIPEKMHNKEVLNWQKKFENLNEKYILLKSKYEKVSSLNIKLQERLLEKPKKVHSFPEKKCMEKNLSFPSMSLSAAPPPSKPPKQSPPAQVSVSEPPKSPSLPQKPTDSPTRTASNNPNQTLPVSSKDSSELFETVQNKIKLLKKVKVGEGGDSLFVKNVSLILWTPEELASSSVTGQRCHAKRDSVPKPALCTEKWKVLCDCFKKRIEEEGSSDEEVKRRLAKVRSFVAEKIVTLNRLPVPKLNAVGRENNIAQPREGNLAAEPDVTEE